ncbi:hypothetical protein AMK06_CH02008 [Rhizobium sp. N541]|uniref:DUF2971 domain-containing protein n=1 Tax=unclassified Rhizobium TaxID=2613769 RepID=UPI0007EE4FFB|nr:MULTISPECIES: DUF2971 domain-containing protein [unclassified Rhizobium]ANM16908.1 hypothetical protein AMK06_CH02008 [Rhizobium sp. N541]ANM23293.1 hypothetical protein AMK07_CH02005 [Rhizobium sp. N941]
MRLYHFTKAEYGLQNVAKRRVKIARIKDLNDPFEFLPLRLPDKGSRIGMREMKKLADKEYGIVCLSDNWQHPMMWSHYADRHRGICLAFDVVGTPPIIPISYADNLLEAKDFKRRKFDDLTVTDFMETWFIKYSSWAYEEERRMIFRLDQEEKDGDLYFHRFEPHLRLAQVIVGAESSVSRQQVANAIGNLADVDTFKARLAFKSFTIRKNDRPRLWK